MLFKVVTKEEMDDVLMISPGKHGSYTPAWTLSPLSCGDQLLSLFLLPHVQLQKAVIHT